MRLNQSYGWQGVSTSGVSQRTTGTSARKSEQKPAIATSPRTRRLPCSTKDAIVVVLDVTGSTRDSVNVVYDKLPMFYRQILDQKYLKDFSISFAAVGDVTCDEHPVQVTEFKQGTELDKNLEALHREGGGGPKELRESHELLAYYYLHYVDFTHSASAKRCLFFITDEAPRASLSADDLKRVFGESCSATSTAAVFTALTKQYEVFALCTPYRGGGYPSIDSETRSEWRKYLPERTVDVSEPKSVVDVMLGLIATRSGGRTIDRYAEEMGSRGQTEARVDNVMAAIRSVRLSH